MHSDETLPPAANKCLEPNSTPATMEFLSAMRMNNLSARRARLCRTFSHLSYPDTPRNDYLGMLCSKLGYGAQEADRAAFLAAECSGSHAPGLCRACYYLHTRVAVNATSDTCSKCQFPAVTGALALASDTQYILPTCLKDSLL